MCIVAGYLPCRQRQVMLAVLYCMAESRRVSWEVWPGLQACCTVDTMLFAPSRFFCFQYLLVVVAYSNVAWRVSAHGVWTAHTGQFCYYICHCSDYVQLLCFGYRITGCRITSCPSLMAAISEWSMSHGPVGQAADTVQLVWATRLPAWN